MTHENALKLKETYGDTISENGMDMSVIVAPADDKDFVQFLAKYRSNKFDDYDSINFSTNSKFRVCGIWSNGTDVLHKQLNS